MWVVFINIGLMFTTIGSSTGNKGFQIAGILFCIAGLISVLSDRKKKKKKDN